MSEWLKVRSTDDIPALCARLGKYLGLQKPVSKAVLSKAVNDSHFAKKLLAARGKPKEVISLLRRVGAEPAEKTNVELLKKAASAFVRWGKQGFAVVNSAVLEKREVACLECPNLGPSERLLQKIFTTKKITGVPGKRLGASICKLCGCAIARKIKLPTEHCPDYHPSLKGLTRWEEPIEKRPKRRNTKNR